MMLKENTRYTHPKFKDVLFEVLKVNADNTVHVAWLHSRHPDYFLGYDTIEIREWIDEVTEL